jgi:hypothetical protein
MRRDEIYALGYPADEAYGPCIEFVSEYADPGDEILDLGGGEGAYSYELNRRGFKCINADLNKKYLSKSRARGVESCAMDARFLGFKDKSFDVVLLFEVIEHIPHYDEVLEEAYRVARKHILITVPNCSDYRKLKEQRLTYDHFLGTDHVNFFAKEDLEALLSKHFNNFRVKEGEPIVFKADPALIISPLLRRTICFLMRQNLTGPKVRFGLGVNYRLYGIVDVV